MLALSRLLLGVCLLLGSPPAYADACAAAVAAQPAARSHAGIPAARLAIIETAAGEIGKVSAQPGADGYKQGWETLIRYYREAAKIDGWPHASYAKELKRAAHRPKDTGHWCGIFATWVLQQTGMGSLTWNVYGKGLRDTSLTHIEGSSGMQPGDIVIIDNGNNHHAIVEEVDGQSVYTIDGNSTCQQIIRQKHPLSMVSSYYQTVP